MYCFPKQKKRMPYKLQKEYLRRFQVTGHQFSGIPGKITVSIGLASVPEASIDTADKLIHTSDLALYQAKAKGRNRIEVA